jgi:hypothetical protein
VRKIAAAALIGFLVLIQPAFGMWMRSESLEWWTNVSDTVAIAEVTSVQEIDLPNQATKTDPSPQYFRSQTITCAVSRTDKGKPRESFTFRQDYRREKRDRTHDDQPLQPKDRLLLFAVEKPAFSDTNVVFWANLTRPDVVESPHAAYNNECKWIGNGDAIIKTVHGRIDAERRENKSKQRGLILEFTAALHEDLHWEFVRTADPECKPGLIKQLRDPRGDKESAIYNLVSYPGKETTELIRPFLKDPTISQIEHYEGTGKTIQTFPLRQAAYSALTLLGNTPQKPEGFYPNASPWLFYVGFESRTYFHYGDWKRVED